MSTMGKNTIGGEMLRGFVERVECINEEIMFIRLTPNGARS